jgi:hypothetical protein
MAIERKPCPVCSRPIGASRMDPARPIFSVHGPRANPCPGSGRPWPVTQPPPPEPPPEAPPGHNDPQVNLNIAAFVAALFSVALLTEGEGFPAMLAALCAAAAAFASHNGWHYNAIAGAVVIVSFLLGLATQI